VAAISGCFSTWFSVVQGLTEFLPISSTPHLRIVPALLGWDDPGRLFTASFNCGTLVRRACYISPLTSSQ